MASTTEPAIRDRHLTLIEAIVPTTESALRFRRHREQRDFRVAMLANPPGCARRFSVTYVPVTEPPEVSNCDVESMICDFEIVVAYPATGRFGSQMLLDAHDVMVADQHLIQDTVGLRGYGNFVGANPNASWLADRASVDREITDAVLFLVIRQGFEFYRDV